MAENRALTEPGSVRIVDGRSVPGFFYGTAWKEDKTRGLVQQALTQGFRGIDTANQRKHYFEQAVGDAIAAAIQCAEVTRDELFIQTKYTFPRGQDHRLPYDPDLPVGDQVWQSLHSSLTHLQTDYVDSLVLHGPSSRDGLAASDWAAWRAMEDIHASGRVRFLGISNVSLAQIKALCEDAKVVPTFIQNRCYASTNWGKDVRTFCRSHDMIYQGFSLLTANRQFLKDARIMEIGKVHGMSISQTIFRFAMDAHILPLTGTSNAAHMKHDLETFRFKLTEAQINTIETVATKR